LPEEVEILSAAETPLPLGVVDKVEADFDTRLDNRFIDLRKPETFLALQKAVLKFLSFSILKRRRFLLNHHNCINKALWQLALTECMKLRGISEQRSIILAGT